MILSILVGLEAVSDGQFDQFTGRGVHGFWFQRWREVDEKFGDELHAVNEVQPFTLSPLLGLPKAQRGVFRVAKGSVCKFRLTALSDALSEAVLSKWAAGLAGQVIQIPEPRNDQAGISWKVTGYEVQFQAEYADLSKRHLMNSVPPRQWTVEFLTPTTFHGRETHLPFPLPDSLIQSWMRRWNAFAPLALPDETVEWARQKLAVSSFTLKTLPAREAERLRVGCVGQLSLRALEMPPYLRAAVDLLVNYSIYCGSGSHTSQGLGQTRFLLCR